MRKLDRVASNWVQGIISYQRAGEFTTRGDEARSYGVLVAYRDCEDGCVYLLHREDARSYSATTARHVAAVRWACEALHHPYVEVDRVTLRRVARVGTSKIELLTAFGVVAADKPQLRELLEVLKANGRASWRMQDLIDCLEAAVGERVPA